VKTYKHLCYLTEFFSEWVRLQTEVVDKMKTHFMCNNFPPKIMPFSWDNVEKHDRAKQVTDHIIVWCRNVICMPGKYGKNTHTHSLHLLLIAFAQHRLLEHTPVLHYTYITCLVNNNVLFIKTLFSLIFYASAWLWLSETAETIKHRVWKYSCI
jgi:hypothetical protein